MPASAAGTRRAPGASGTRDTRITTIAALTAGRGCGVTLAPRPAVTRAARVTTLSTRPARPVGAVGGQHKQQPSLTGVTAIPTVTGRTTVSA